MHSHGTKFADRGYGEELIESKVGGVHSTDTDYDPPNYASSVYMHI